MQEEKRLLGDKYLLDRVIGSGGMSTVYLAIDQKLHIKWAAKEIRIHKDTEIYDKKSIRAEIMLLRRAQHRNLPRIVDAFCDKNAVIVIMDYIEGTSLKELLKTQQKLPAKEVLRIAFELVDTLNYLHHLDPPIIYGDMKPSNVIIKPDGKVQLIDFGSTIERTLSNKKCVTYGTKGYCAPEQYQGYVDERSDIYSLGITLYQCLIGERPQKSFLEKKTFINWRGMGAWEKVIKKCIVKNPDQRIQDMRMLQQELNNLETNKKKKVIIFLIAFLTILIAISIFYGSQISKERDDMKQVEYQRLLEESDAKFLDGNIVEASLGYEILITEYDSTNKLAYQKLIRLYQREHEFKELIQKMEEYEDRGLLESEKNPEIFYELGILSFYDLKDYYKANGFFEKSGEAYQAEAYYYQSICEILLSFNWEKQDLQKTLIEFSEMNQNLANLSQKIKNSQSIADIYMMYEEELPKGLFTAIELLMEQQKMLGIYQGEDKEIYQKESLTMLSTIYRMLGKRDSKLRNEYYRKSIQYSKELFSCEGVKEESVYQRKLSDMAYMYQEMGEKEKAEACYREWEKEHPESGADLYIEHLNFLLDKNARESEIEKIYIQLLKFENIMDNQNFLKISRRMKEREKNKYEK
ncbi:MAG: serine/threonine-protein kinase [Lachnospiraceae bacterium]|nr:serine/threonine-protein kinase [Lachnospiraceae bacterium]